MKSTPTGAGVAACLIFLSLVPSAELATAQVEVMGYAAPTCFPSTHHPRVTAALGRDVAGARVFFKSDVGADFFYVDMAPVAGGWEAILPQPQSPPTRQVELYLETYYASEAYERTQDMTIPVLDGCDGASYLDDTKAAIVLGSDVPGVTAGAPPGFLPTGITGFINSSGTTTSLGAAASSRLPVVLLIGAGAAAAAAIIVTTGGEQTVSPANP